MTEADGLIDDIVEETSSFGVEDEVVDETTEGVDDTIDDGEETTDDSTDDGTDEIDCSEPLFSPAPPECQT